MLKKRVLAWGTGYLGVMGLKKIIEHPDLELVGLQVWSPEKVGVDAGTIAGTALTGIKATNDQEALLALKPDCIAYFANTAGRTAESVAEIIPFLEAGVNVVSISHFDMQYPAYGQPEFVDPIVEACEKGQASFLLTGEEPGFAFGQHLFSILSTTGKLEQATFTEMSNVQMYGGLESLKMYGFNEDPAKKPPMFTSEVGASWHIGTLKGIADFLRVDVEKITQEWDSVAVDFPIQSAAYGEIAPGLTAATRWTVTAHVAGQPFLTYEKILRMHEDAGAEWETSALSNGREGVTHKIRIKGEPEVDEELFRPNGVSATPIIPVNAIPFVCDARPGVLLQQDLPLFPPRIFPF